MAATCSSDVEPWQAELHERIADERSWGNERNTEAAEILLEMFLSFPQENGHLASSKAALRIAADYWAKFLPSSQDPLNKPYMMEDKGMTEYLSLLYDLIFHQSWLLRYDDPRQELLVRLLVDLQNLPKVTYKSEGREYHAFHNDPVFLMMSDEYWNAKFASDRPQPEDPKQERDFISDCDEWANFSAFQARYHGSSALGSGADLKFPSIDIPLALKADLPAGRLGDCRLLVASHWITHAGNIIHDSMVRKNTDEWDLKTWQDWLKTITETLGSKSRKEEVNLALRRALQEMKSVDLGLGAK